jgi:hypothetical protein
MNFNQEPDPIKGQFLAKYWGVKCLKSKLVNNALPPIKVDTLINNLGREDQFLELKSLADITDEDIIQICIMCHNLPELKQSDFLIKRHKFDEIHCSYTDKTIDAKRNISLNFKLATIDCSLSFHRDGDNEAESFKQNIGEISLSATRVVGYIQCLDYLRQNAYAVPFRDFSISELEKMEWIKVIGKPF